MRRSEIPWPRSRYLSQDRLADDGSGCWRWRGTHHPNGYAYFDGQLAHRYVWQLVHGPIEPSSLVLHHVCGMRDCVRPEPDHLVLRERGSHIREHRDQERARRPARSLEQRRERNRQARRLWLARQGLRFPHRGCRSCLQPAAPGRTQCQAHLDAERAYKRSRALVARTT